jgi:hypothetical protein
LDAKRALYVAEDDQARSETNSIVTLIAVYKALGADGRCPTASTGCRRIAAFDDRRDGRDGWPQRVHALLRSGSWRDPEAARADGSSRAIDLTTEARELDHKFDALIQSITGGR